MIDFHTHTLLSDGVLVPSELVRRANKVGYRAIGLADHVDGSTLEPVIRAALRASADLNRFQDTVVLPGVEITHAPPAQIGQLVLEARKLGALVIVVHGESPVEPVAPGTNRAAIEARADILAHPGFLTLEDARLAAEKGVFLEITARSGHSLTNGHVARIALEAGARLVINTDTHTPDNLITRARAFEVLVGAGLTTAQANAVLETNEQLLADFNQRLQQGDRAL
ncbi:MAG: histidinol phosphate phosphatase domain-containing protein [Desulfomonile tiedjei]|nr:histidinol phosphate phosphatase domain-containing protein [Desulfomonile tiedjei]